MKNLIFAFLLFAGISIAQTQPKPQPTSVPVNLETGTDPKPHITNAKMQTVDAASGLRPVVDRIIKEPGPLWMAYTIPTQRKERSMCCFDYRNGADGCCTGCKLENREGSYNIGTVEGSNCTQHLEPTDYAFVFMRAEGGHITKTRVFSADCAVDAAGLPFYWLTGVKASESVALLAGLVRSNDVDPDRGKRVGSNAIMSIAMHNDSSVDPTLESFLAQNMPSKIRQDTAFWIGNERGKKGLEILRKVVKNDPDPAFRRKAIFAFTQAENGAGLKDLLDFAKNDPNTGVRGEAIFWLAQAGGKKVGEQITDLIENDPDTQLKEKAVFALTQMPNEEGVPMLINVARTNKNPAVRKKAIFWLGQTKDPRAVDFLEEILFGGKTN
jgi:HEAT repeat protein